jgi:hypothetical protein
MPDTATATKADAAAYTAILGLAARLGPDRAAGVALYASAADPRWPVLVFLAARGTDIDDVIGTLRLAPGELADVANVAIPAPASPLPPGEATVFPDDDDDDAVWAAGPYLTRQRLTLLRDVSEPTAAALAVCVPGVRGLVLFMAARGDTRHDVAATLGISIDDVDDVLDHTAGQHVSRPPG